MIELDSKSLNSLAGSIASNHVSGTTASTASGHSRKSSDASQISLNSGEWSLLVTLSHFNYNSSLVYSTQFIMKT